MDDSETSETPQARPIVYGKFQFSCKDANGDDYAGVELYIQPPGVMWMTSLFVAKDERGKGIASRILTEMLRYFGHYPIYCRVKPYADGARDFDYLIAFYRRFGFVQTELPFILFRSPIANL